MYYETQRENAQNNFDYEYYKLNCYKLHVLISCMYLNFHVRAIRQEPDME